MTANRHENGDPLSYRETRALYWLSHGLTNKQVADRLHISEATVKNHVGAVLRKMGANDRAHAVRLGFERGVLRADEVAS